MAGQRFVLTAQRFCAGYKDFEAPAEGADIFKKIFTQFFHGNSMCKNFKFHANCAKIKSKKIQMEEAFMDLSTLRNEIDRIDSQLVQLYEQRMEICSQVAEYKIENGKKSNLTKPERKKSWRGYAP